MTSAIIESNSNMKNYLPLVVKSVEDKQTIGLIGQQLHVWQLEANKMERGVESFYFGKQKTRSVIAEDYYDVVKKTCQIVQGKIGKYGPRESDVYKEFQIVAAFDLEGSLQGVGVFRNVGREEVAAKIEYLVTALWNMPFENPKKENRTQGVGTCLIRGVIDALKSSGSLFVEPTEKAKPFFAKREFVLIPDFVPTVFGASCGMSLPESRFERIRNICAKQIVSNNKSESLPVPSKCSSPDEKKDNGHNK